MELGGNLPTDGAVPLDMPTLMLQLIQVQQKQIREVSQSQAQQEERQTTLYEQEQMLFEQWMEQNKRDTG